MSILFPLGGSILLNTIVISPYKGSITIPTLATMQEMLHKLSVHVTLSLTMKLSATTVCTCTCNYLFCLNHISCLFPGQPLQADPVHGDQLITWTQGAIIVSGGTMKHLWRCEGIERVIIIIDCDSVQVWV